ncbi:MAG: FAD-dependent oxidoreductase [Chlamydiota bacterium]
MKLIQAVSALCLSFSISTAMFAEKIEVLTPPIIKPASIDEKIMCTRPMREGKFNISSEEKEGKLLVHCYGHGGSGCTTSFGSVKKAIKLFEDQLGDLPATPIRVIGSGIIGMIAAIELSLKGYQVAGITAKEFYDIPSWKNAGYFALVSVQTDPEEQLNLNKIGLDTFKEFKVIHEGKHPYITSECARLLPVYCSVETEAGVEDLENEGLIPEREYVTLDFGNGVIRPNFVKFITYFMDTTQIMIQLRETVAKLEIPVEEKEFKTFSEVTEEIVFNCSGLGAKSLNGDDKMVAVRGHLLNLNEQSGREHMNYMIYTKVKDADGSDEYVYMFPKCLQVTSDCPDGKVVYGTLGGTFIPGTDVMRTQELEQLDRTELDRLYSRNLNFFWGKTSDN